MWLLGCAGAANDPNQKPQGSFSGNGGAGMTATGGSGVAMMHGGSGSAAGSTSLPIGGGSGTISAGSGGSVTTGGAGGSQVAGSGGGGMAGSNEPQAGTGEAGAGGNGDAGSNAPVSYPMLDEMAIGAPVMITSGFTLAESPIWDHCGHQLLFSDVQGGTAAQGVVHTLSTSGTLGVFADGTTNANGIAFDVDGSLIMSQMGGGGHIARREKSGTIKVLEEMGGPNLHTPDDVTVKSDGTIYFSDGDFYPIGNLLGYATQLPVYMLKPGTSTLVKVATVGGPNGIEFGPNEDTLFVSAYGEGTIYKFTPGSDGTLTKTGSLITGLDKNDSMCLDAAGNVYVGVHTGLQILRADGTKVKLLPIPGYTTTTGTTSCTFGGDDGKTLYITSWTTIYKVEGMPIPGLDWQVNNTRFACN